MDVDFDVYGAEAAQSRLEWIGERATDMRPVMSRIRDLLIRGHIKQFATGGRYLGTPWPELADATLSRKERLGQPPEPMVASGKLKASLSGGRGRRTRVGRSFVSVGTSLFYAIFHINPKRKAMPARPPVGISEADHDAALTMMQRFIAGATV